MPPSHVDMPNLTVIPRLRPEVANALQVLMQAIRDEFTVRGVGLVSDPMDMSNSAYARAAGWKLFVLDAFCDLLMQQVADTMTLEALAENDPPDAIS